MVKICYRIKSKIFPYKPPSIDGYTFDQPYPQIFPFPSDMMKHITFNPTTAKMWKKLVKTCKYFYSKNPIILCDYYSHGKNIDQISISWKRKYLTFKADTIKFKVWLTDSILENSTIAITTYVATLTSKIYQNDIKKLLLSRMTISFDDLNILANNRKLESLNLRSVKIKDNNGKIVTVEEIAEAYPNVLFLSYECCSDNLISITQKTAQRLIEIYHPTSPKLIGINLENLPEQFDFQYMFDYIMQKPMIFISLSFDDNLPLVYKEKLKSGVNKILASNKTILPYQTICLPGADEDSLKPLYSSLRQRLIYTYKAVKFLSCIQMNKFKKL